MPALTSLRDVTLAMLETYADALPDVEYRRVRHVVTENDPQEINRAFKHGADTYLTKPYNREIVEMKLLEMRVAANRATRVGA